MSKRFGLKVVLFLLSMGLLAGVNAQTSTVGNISGYVRDPQGATVPKAEVTITEERTGASRAGTLHHSFLRFARHGADRP